MVVACLALVLSCGCCLVGCVTGCFKGGGCCALVCHSIWCIRCWVFAGGIIDIFAFVCFLVMVTCSGMIAHALVGVCHMYLALLLPSSNSGLYTPQVAQLGKPVGNTKLSSEMFKSLLPTSSCLSLMVLFITSFSLHSAGTLVANDALRAMIIKCFHASGSLEHAFSMPDIVNFETNTIQLHVHVSSRRPRVVTALKCMVVSKVSAAYNLV